MDTRPVSKQRIHYLATDGAREEGGVECLFLPVLDLGLSHLTSIADSSSMTSMNSR